MSVRILGNPVYSVHPLLTSSPVRSFVIAVVLLASTAETLGASATPSPCEAFGAATAVFIGEAHSPTHRNVRQWDGSLVPIKVSPLTVERAFRGVSTSFAYIVPAGTETYLTPGEKYLVYGREYEPTEVIFMSSGLYGTKRVSEAAEDLEFLDAVLPNTAGAIVGGVVDVDESDSAHIGTHVSPLPNVTVRLSGSGRSVVAVTTADGRFAVSGLPSGSYSAEPTLANDVTLLDNTSFPRTARVAAGGCAAVHLRAIPNGRIAGTLRAWDGQRLISAQLSLLPAELRKGQPDGYFQTVSAGEDGHFEFVGVRPGRYVIGRLGFNLNLRPIPSIYFPGTLDREAAQTIEVGRSTSHDIGEFRLLPRD